MSETVHVALDGMGGDNAPSEIVKGAVEALKEIPALNITLTGPAEVLMNELKKYSYPEDRITVCHAAEVIAMDEHPVEAIRMKRDSSLVKALTLVKNGECDAVVSAGSTGAILAGGQLIVGRIRGIERSPLAAIVPSANGVVLLLDSGANMDPRPSMLLQFAQMGSVYMKGMTGIENPKVGLLNVGTEETKGNSLAKQAYALLKECGTINFAGNVEARDIADGTVDVIVTDAFTGNAVLKMFEGVAGILLKGLKGALTSDVRSKMGALLVKPALKGFLGRFDVSNHGGAPMLGLRGLVVKTHGNSTSAEIRNALAQCVDFKEKQINENLRREMNL